MKKFVFRSLFLLLFVYLAIVITMFAMQRSLLYFPKGGIADDVAMHIMGQGQIIHVETADNIKLKAYLVPPKNNTKPVVLVFHGNSSLALDLHKHFDQLINDGYGVLYAEYRGYGGNEGEVSEAGLYKDADAYLLYLNNKYKTNPVIIYGQSLGSGVAVDLASRSVGRYHALILYVPFDSIVGVVEKTYPFIPFKSLLVRDKYMSIDKVANINVPMLFLVAGRDEVVGADGGKRLFAAAKAPKKIVEFQNAAHNNVYAFGAEGVIFNFIKQIELPINASIELINKNGVLHQFNVQIVNTPAMREKGLMWVKHLNDNNGMLFVFDKVNIVNLWMKNTFIPLDILFVDSDFRVTKIHKMAKPHDLTPISSDIAVKYALEINGGMAEKIGLSVGDKIILKN